MFRTASKMKKCVGEESLGPQEPRDFHQRHKTVRPSVAHYLNELLDSNV